MDGSPDRGLIALRTARGQTPAGHCNCAAQALAAQTDDLAMQSHFATLAKTLTDNEKQITEELNAVQGKPADIGGYYLADLAKVTAVMRPSATLNAALGG